MNSLYQLEFIKKKNGENSTRKAPKKNRSGNPTTIGLFEAINRLRDIDLHLNKNLVSSIESLIELRDNAIHFHNEKDISKHLQELGFACIKNYMGLIRLWEIEIELGIYNFYLMPLAYVDAKVQADSILTDEVKNYVSFVKNKVSEAEKDDEEFDIAISIDINFKKTNSFEAIPFQYGEDGVHVTMTEENIRDLFPLTYNEVVSSCKERYSDFKKNPAFNSVMHTIKSDSKLFHLRKLDPNGTSNSQSKPFYSSNIWQTLDKKYTKHIKFAVINN
jgi:hypothetical protein